MSMSDPISDFLTRIRNAQAAGKRTVTAPASKLKLHLGEVLKAEGYINDVSVSGEGAQAVVTVTLKYFGGKPVIERLDRASAPRLQTRQALARQVLYRARRRRRRVGVPPAQQRHQQRHAVSARGAH